MISGKHFNSLSHIKIFEIKRAYLACRTTIVILESHVVVYCGREAISSSDFELSFQTVVCKSLFRAGAQNLL